MSLLTAVIIEANQAEINEFNMHYNKIAIKINPLMERIRTLTLSVKEILHDYYVKLSPNKSLHQINFYKRREKLITEYNLLNAEAVSLYRYENGQEELKRLTDELQALFTTFLSYNTMADCQVNVQRATNELEKRKYGQSLTSLQKMRLSLHDLCHGEFHPIAKRILNVVNIKYSECLAEISDEWENCLAWSESKCLYNIVHKIEVDQCDELHKRYIIKTLHETGTLYTQLITFTDFFITNLVQMLSTRNCDISTDEDMNMIVLNIKYNENDRKKPTVQTVLYNLVVVFDFIKSTLDMPVDGNNSFISALSEMTASQFYEKLSTNCLKYAFSKSESKMTEYNDAMSELESFQKYLIDIKYTSAEESPFKKYLVEHEQTLYKNICINMLVEARKSMETQLQHNVINVGNYNKFDDERTQLVDTTVTNYVNDKISSPLFMPNCKISSYVKDLWILISRILSEADAAPDLYKTQYVDCVKEISVMYQTLVPTLCGQSLQVNPQDIAVFRNNCFYLAHGLLGNPWKMSLANDIADYAHTVLLDQVTDLRALGTNFLTSYFQNQKEFIKTTIRPTTESTFHIDYCEPLQVAITSCISHLRLVASNMRGTLPHDVYSLQLASVVTYLCQALIQKFYTNKNAEFSLQVMELLSAHYSTVIEDIPQFFRKETNLQETVSDWRKYKTLIELFTMEMYSVSTAWDKGQGDLAKLFTCEEIRLLIKIRCRESEYRKNILGTIQ